MLNYALVRPAVQRSDLAALPPYLLGLMLRNISSAGFAFADPADPRQFSAPGCIIASPSFAGDQAAVTQDYVYNWTRDAAVTAAELAHAGLPAGDAGGTGPLDDYVSFASTCQQNAPGLDTASYTIEGQPRPGWPLQNDGPALQALAIFEAFAQLSPDAQGIARTVAGRDLEFIVDRYQTFHAVAPLRSSSQAIRKSPGRGPAATLGKSAPTWAPPGPRASGAVQDRPPSAEVMAYGRIGACAVAFAA